ncbi:MAG: hypothetical protein CMF62_08200 [Magnetococcales bacterium]|nr:hypothetical protein [Magnetococcales bacterium]|tara:strand:- start:568 stop:825 length:258 start_codon:yes stop_codon:yes gene_type:complete
MSEYFYIIVETYYAIKAGKSSRVHVRPIEGQIFPTSMDVECSRKMRKDFPVGTQFKIPVKLTDREGGKPFLYSSYKWCYEVIQTP